MTALMWAFLALTASLGAVRAVVEVTLVEPLTGFYSGPSALITVQNVLMILAIAVLAALLFRSPRRFSLHVWGWSRPLGLLLFASGAALSVTGVITLCVDAVAFSNGSAEVNLMILIAEAAGIAAGAAMILPSIALFFSGEYRGGMWTGAVCALWMGLEMVARFMAYPTIASISDQKFEVVTLCLGALFWLAHARVVSDGKLLPSPRYAKFWALLFSMFSVVLCAGQLASLPGGGSAVHMALPRQAVFLLLAAYAAVWCRVIRFEKEEAA